MTDLQQRAIRALRAARVSDQTWHYAKAKLLYMRLVDTPDARLGITEEADLWFLVWRYRRQIEDRVVVAHAEELMTGARNLSFV